TWAWMRQAGTRQKEAMAVTRNGSTQLLAALPLMWTACTQKFARPARPSSQSPAANRGAVSAVKTITCGVSVVAFVAVNGADAGRYSSSRAAPSYSFRHSYPVFRPANRPVLHTFRYQHVPFGYRAAGPSLRYTPPSGSAPPPPSFYLPAPTIRYTPRVPVG